MTFDPAGVKRVRAIIRGRVQGVGFRPTVYRYAVESGLAGFVRNDPAGVVVEVEGPPEAVRRFMARLRAEPPRQARIETIDECEAPPRREAGFRIESSARSGDFLVGLPPDLALCGDCARELASPSDRRYRYPFINCTNCGPRFTIVSKLPYDRPWTSMADFPMCPECRREYEDPLDRRFDAQPNACPVCGPSVRLIDAEGRDLPGDPVRSAGERLRAGQTLAVKGLGGYHLCCLAASDAAVARLRERKGRPSKALAVMFASLAGVRAACATTPAEEALLESAAAPIVLLPRREGCTLSPLVSPDTDDVGAFLPYTPLHKLLLAEAEPLVMTSGNRSEEPIIRDEDELPVILGPIADAALVHNRRILRRCDDSVVRIAGGRPLPLRRARGYVPDAIELPLDGPPVLACGGEIKGAFCITRGRQALMSQHLGDVSDYRAYRFFTENVEDFARLLGVQPRIVACDMHPDYLTARYGRKRPARVHTEVQHHHAHIAACMAEHGLTAPVIGVALDGTGYGPDGTVWGGEFLIADLADYRRFARLSRYALPGGEEAVRHPVRMAASCLLAELGADAPRQIQRLLPGLPAGETALLRRVLERGLRSPPTSSAGRLFDAVSALLGLCDHAEYEGQAAVRLQTAALRAVAAGGLPGEPWDFEIAGDPPRSPDDAPLVLSLGPTLRRIADERARGADSGRLAAAFHVTLAASVAEVCLRARAAAGLDTVCLSGGCFQNDLLLGLVRARLAPHGFTVCSHEKVPPNDGGLSLGQAAVALARYNLQRA